MLSEFISSLLLVVSLIFSIVNLSLQGTNRKNITNEKVLSTEELLSVEEEKTTNHRQEQELLVNTTKQSIKDIINIYDTNMNTFQTMFDTVKDEHMSIYDEKNSMLSDNIDLYQKKMNFTTNNMNNFPSDTFTKLLEKDKLRIDNVNNIINEIDDIYSSLHTLVN